MAKQVVKFCADFIQDAPLPEVISWWKAADEAGLDWLGIPDSPILVRELWVSCTLAAVHTKRIPFAPNVSNPISRHPSVTASCLFSLDEVAPGRVSLGIGVGDSAIYGIGLTQASVEYMRQYIRAVKGLLRGEEVEWQGKSFKPEWRHWSPPKNIPIYVACSGPKITRMAAQEAEGIIGGMGYAPENIQYFRDLIKEGCAEVGRDPSIVDIWWAGMVNFGRSKEEVMAQAPVTSHTLGRATLEGKQIPDKYKPAIKKLSEQWTLAGHGRPRTDLIKMAKDMGVYEWLMNRSPRLWGTPEDVCERISELAELGVNRWSFVVRGGEHDRLEWINLLSKYVMPNFR